MKKTILILLLLITNLVKGQYFDISKIIFDNIIFENPKADSTYRKHLDFEKENFNVSFIHKSLSSIASPNSKNDECSILILNSFLDFKNGNNKTALKNALIANKMAEKNNSKTQVLACNVLISNIYRSMEAFDLSIQSLSNCNSDKLHEIFQIKWMIAGDYYAEKDYAKAFLKQQEVEKISKNISFLDYRNTYSYLTIYAEESGDYSNALRSVLKEDSLLKNYNGSLFKNSQILYTNSVENYDGYITMQRIVTLNDIGYLYRKMGSYDVAEFYLVTSIELANQLKNKEYMSFVYGNTALNYTLLKKYGEADKYYNLSLEFYTGEKNDKKIAETYNLIGKNKFLKNEPQEAFVSITKAIETAQKRSDYINLSASYFILSEIYSYYGDYQNSQKNYKLFTELSELGKKKKNDKINANLKNNLTTKTLTTDFEREIAEKEKKEFEIIALKLESEQKEQELLLLKSENSLKEKTLANQQLEKEKVIKSLALITAQLEKEKIIKNNDILIKEKELTKMEGINLKNKIFLLRKESQVLESEKKIKEVELIAKNRQQKILRSGIALLCLAVSLMFFLLNKNRKQKKLIEIKNGRLTELSDTLSLSNNQLETSILEVENQKSIIQEKNYQIVESINYAQRIQDSFLISEQTLSSMFQSAFVLFKPKDIVSGDFYFTKQIDKKIYFAIGDSTGHGVPGSMISIIGLNELNHLIKGQIKCLSSVLLSLNQSIYKLLNSTSNRIGSDGIDLMLVEIDTENKKIKIAGARGMAALVIKNTFYDVKGNRISIGEIAEENFSFTEHNFEYTNGDSIYLFTDGYYDQIGGPNKKKMGSMSFKKALEEMNSKSCEDQKIHLENKFNDWLKGNKQLDDVTVVGIKLK